MLNRIAKKPRKQATQNRSRATVAALIEATARILTSEGFDKASTNRIAEVAGVSVGSLYQYFPSKEALVLAVAERHRQDILRVVGDVLEEIDGLSLEAAVGRLVTVAIEGHRVDPELHRVLAEQIPRTGLLEQVDSAIGEARAVFRAYLENQRDDLGPIDLDLATFVCTTSIEALAHNAVLHNPDIIGNDAAKNLVADATRMIIGYLKRP